MSYYILHHLSLRSLFHTSFQIMSIEKKSWADQLNEVMYTPTYEYVGEQGPLVIVRGKTLHFPDSTIANRLPEGFKLQEVPYCTEGVFFQQGSRLYRLISDDSKYSASRYIDLMIYVTKEGNLEKLLKRCSFRGMKDTRDFLVEHFFLTPSMSKDEKEKVIQDSIWDYQI